ncbi:MetQ/NlpA family ABC transporter substrate-binding protein [Bacillus sp. FJAT-44742]|uniref:MetQ/NlpA family ABC transporter substrate-binding protein n=1 Tax=Bacillus sp. FJAT-44742 TaxID=2014005 RepID=UPI000C24946F|nr:MetQ/NlpA family ABC transporter substrate-binding protein [Bacillus sp. FJAT-44742]
MKYLLHVLSVFALVLVLAACGTAEEDDTAGDGEGNGTEVDVEEAEEGVEEDDTDATEEEEQELTIGASNVPHAEILEFASDQLEEEGITLDIRTFNDYIVPNQALDQEELDANYFQHIPYLESQIEEHGYDFENAGGIHIEPIGVYSQEYDSLDDLPEGAEIIMSSSVADHGRILSMLEDEGLITLTEGAGVEATIDDIEENPRDLDFRDNVEAAMLPQAFDNNEGDAVLINSNYAIDHGLSPAEDAIAIESPDDNPYVNVIAVRSGDEDNEAIQTLVEVLRSEEVQDFILEEYDGSVVPVNE